MKARISTFGLLSLAFAPAACSDSTTGRVEFAVSSRAAPAAPGAPLAAAAAGDSTVFALGDDTLIVRSVDVVLREIELERVEVADCDSIEGNGDCEEFESGPVLVSLPLGNATEVAIAIDASPGMYDELELEVHKPDELQDAAFIAAHPDFADVSIRVTGTFSRAGTRTDFAFTSDLNEKQEVAIDPPLTVSEGDVTTVTLRLDLSSWFVDAGGTALVDPATANKGGANENLVRDHIRASIDAFRDDDHDGLDDDHES